jgi:hypothetical protein
MNVIFILVMYNLHLGSGTSTNWRALRALVGSLELCSNYGLWLKVLCFALCLFDATLESNPMDEKMLNDFLIGK